MHLSLNRKHAAKNTKTWFDGSNGRLVDIPCIVNMISWSSYSLKWEELKLCVGNDFYFPFEMLVILVIIFSNWVLWIKESTWFNYSVHWEQVKLCVGNDFYFLFQVLVILVIVFLQLSFWMKLSNSFFVIDTLKKLLYVWYLLLHCFISHFKKKHAVKNMKRTWFAGWNEWLVHFLHISKHVPVKLLFAKIRAI